MLTDLMWITPVCVDNAHEFMAAAHIVNRFRKKTKIETKLNLNVIN